MIRDPSLLGHQAIAPLTDCCPVGTSFGSNLDTVESLGIPRHNTGWSLRATHRADV